ncbi:S8 family serine peptidase [Flavitalea antarctica]
MPFKSRPHIKLNTEKQKEDTVTLRFNYGSPEEEDDEVETPAGSNYRQMANSFKGYLARFNQDQERRVADRNEELAIPGHIEYIRILFQNQFSITAGAKNYYQSWYNDFGLLGVRFSRFNHEVLFAVTDQRKFHALMQGIRNFSIKESGEDPKVTYPGKVRYIKEFKLLTSNDILQFQGPAELLNFKLIDFPLTSQSATSIWQGLKSYLEQRGLRYVLVEDCNNLEVYNATEKQAQEIANNFDIVYSVTSGLATVVRPNEFNTTRREYGFSISNTNEELPIIGVLDTGISNKTPLAPILINDDTFNLSGSSVFLDSANDGYGHGTAVAAFAALGRTPYLIGDYRGNYNADAKLLSMKILDDDSGYLSERAVLELLRSAKAKYPTLKLFVLTVCYARHKKTNEDFSTYAYELDKFAHQNDCLIFICTANNNDACNNNNSYDLGYFFGESTNLCCPADSLNNVVVGGAAHVIKDGVFRGISHSKEYPTLYTRKSHIDFSGLFPKMKHNKNYFRPDVIECAGDYEQSGNFIGQGNNASMDVLCANPSIGFFKHIGTSFSAPLTANIAAKIQKIYPSLRAQSIKALIINSASLNSIRFEKPFSNLLNKTAGHGLVDPDKSILSNDNEVTFVIEDSVRPEEVKIIPLHFPEYLSTDELGKRVGLLTVSATLCFSFDPVLENHLAYCPIHMAFSFFRNHAGEDILKKEDAIKSKLKSTLTWSQNGRYKSKPVPSFNTQKIHFRVGADELVSEESTLKLAINCRLNPQLLPGMEARYGGDHPFSLVVTIKEDLPEARQTGKLYAEMLAVNEVENIITVELENDLQAEG